MHPDRDAWLAAGGDPFRLDLYARVGAVAPFSDGDSRALATIHPAEPTLGCIGDAVGDPALIRAAEDWLRAQGCRTVHGPKEMCAWFSYRACLGPFDEAPFSWEPTARAAPWEALGYRPIQNYVSILADHEEQIAAGRDAAAALSLRGWRIEALPADANGHVPEALFNEAIGTVHALFSSAYADVEGFAPVPPDVLRAYYGRYRTALDPRLTLLAFEPDGTPAGVVLAIPDHAQPERRWFQVMTLAVVPRLRQRGIGTWMMAACHKAARQAGFKAGVHALIRVEGSDDHTWYRGKLIRRYALLAKEL